MCTCVLLSEGSKMNAFQKEFDQIVKFREVVASNSTPVSSPHDSDGGGEKPPRMKRSKSIAGCRDRFGDRLKTFESDGAFHNGVS